MSRQQRTDAKLSAYDGPHFPPVIDELTDLIESSQRTRGWYSDVACRIDGFLGDPYTETSDGYSWFASLEFAKGTGSVRVLFPYFQDWDRSDGSSADRAVALYTRDVDENAAGEVARELIHEISCQFDLDNVAYSSNSPEGLTERDVMLNTAEFALVTRNPEAIELAIGLVEQALSTLPPDSPDRGASLNDPQASGLVSVLDALRLVRGSEALRLSEEALRTHDPTQIDSAIAILNHILATIDAEDPQRPGFLTNYGLLLRLRFERLGTIADLEKAVDTSRQAVNLMPPTDVDRPVALTNYSTALLDRFKQKAMPTDIQAAETAAREALEAAPADSLAETTTLSNLGIVLMTLAERTERSTVIDEAVETLRRASESTPDIPVDQGTIMSNLGAALLNRYLRNGFQADLDEAIEVARNAIQQTSPSDANYPRYLTNLAVALSLRYERSEAFQDLNEASDLYRDVAMRVDPRNPDYSSYLNNLSGAYRSLHQRFHRPNDLDQAIEYARRAASLASIGSHAHSIAVSNLSLLLRLRYLERGDAADLDESIDFARKGAKDPIEIQGSASKRLNLSRSLGIRFDCHGRSADLSEAIEIGRGVVELSSENLPEYGNALLNLATQLFRRLTSADPSEASPADDLEHALALCRRATRLKTFPPQDRAKAARQWGRLASWKADWKDAAEAYAQAVELLPFVVPRSLARDDQEFQLAELAGLGSEAAACCLQAGQLQRAVELFEHGRGVLFSQALDTHTDLSQLTARHPELAERFVCLRDELDRPLNDLASDWVAGFRADPATAAQARIDRYRVQVAEFDQLLEEIRAQEGFRRFLLPAPFAELRQAAVGGPVVLVNVSTIRSDALLLTAARGVQVLPLPALDPEVVRDQVARLLGALGWLGDPAADEAARAVAEAELLNQLGWLWDAVTGPVLEALSLVTKPAEEVWPRLWWCPSGLLAFLPLHAAGHHATRLDPVPSTVLDRVVPGYTPTIRALTHARRPATLEATTSRAGPLLVVAMAHTPGGHDLPGVAAESELLEGLYPGTLVLADSNATYDSVTTALPGYPWAHFACHGLSDLDHPSDSCLLLADHGIHRFTVVDVSRLRLEQAELVYLSACSTARTGARLADEAIHLAAAFQLAGYRHVIATLWPVDDQAARRIAGDIYLSLGTDVSDAAVALHAAIRGLRDDPDEDCADRPSIWAAHLYNGS